MASNTESKYMYNIEMAYISNNTKETIDPGLLSNMMILYDYEKNNQPAIILSVNVSSDLYNRMQKGSKKDKLYLKVQKYDSKASVKIMKTYIEEQFTYYFSDTNLDYLDDVESAAVTNAKNSNAYRKVNIGLLKSELINNSKIMVNQVFNGGTIMSVVLYYLDKMKLVIEPFSNNKPISSLIIPPMEGLSKLLKYLNKKVTFYKSGYRFFMDYDKTYLLSKSGTLIDLKDGTYNTVKIKINKEMSDMAHIQGMVSDNSNKIYIIPVDVSNTNVSINKSSEKICNSIYGIDSSGNVSKKDLNINKSKDTNTIYKVYRVPDDNMDYLNTIQSDLQLANTLISIVKADLDVTIITPNREYIIENHDKYSSLDGKYLLLSKKEVYAQQDGEFRCSTMISFAKIEP